MTPEEFKDSRLALGYTQAALAKLWGMSDNGKRTIRRWERGEIAVNPIAAYLVLTMLSIKAKL